MSDFVPGTVLAEEADEASTEKIGAILEENIAKARALHQIRRRRKKERKKDLIVCPLE